MFRRFIIILFMVAALAAACSTIKEPPQRGSIKHFKTNAVRTVSASVAPTTTPPTTAPPTTIPPTTVAPAQPVVAPSVTTPQVAATPTSPADLVAAWTKVAVCEEGGWIGSSGSVYPDSLGINATNWYAYGGTSDTSIDAQIAVGQRMIAALGIGIPDQNGCAPW